MSICSIVFFWWIHYMRLCIESGYEQRSTKLLNFKPCFLEKKNIRTIWQVRFQSLLTLACLFTVFVPSLFISYFVYRLSYQSQLLLSIGVFIKSRGGKNHSFLLLRIFFFAFWFWVLWQGPKFLGFYRCSEKNSRKMIL